MINAGTMDVTRLMIALMLEPLNITMDPSFYPWLSLTHPYDSLRTFYKYSRSSLCITIPHTSSQTSRFPHARPKLFEYLQQLVSKMPAGFVSIALARSYSSERDIIKTLNASKGDSSTQVVNQVRFDIPAEITPTTSRGLTKLPSASPPQISSPTSAPVKYTSFPAPVVGQSVVNASRLSRLTGSVQHAVKRRKLAPTGEFEAILDAELREKRKVETKKIGREVWW